MSNTQTTMNTKYFTHLDKVFYDKHLLEAAKTRRIFTQFGQKRSVPANSGRRVEFRRYELFDTESAASPLHEGVTPDGQALTQRNVEAELAQYGAYVEVSDLLLLTAFDGLLHGSAKLLGEELATALEWITRDAILAGTNVQYASGKPSRDALTVSDVLTAAEIQKAVRTLKKAKARPFYGKGRQAHFICICSPEATYDLQCDPLWRDSSAYSDAEQVYSGEIGKLFGVAFVESTEAKVFKEEGGMDVHATLVFGADAYGVIDLEAKDVLETILHTPKDGGAEDPLAQQASIGVKAEAFAATILNPLWIVRIEHYTRI